jgi:HAD superfamily hydrolase (TIGR01509 family)
MSRIWLFDLDGTLIDSMPTGVDIVLQFLRERGVSYPDNFIEIITPLGYKGISKYYAEKMGISMTAEEIFSVFQQRTFEEYGKNIPLKKGVKETLEALKTKGDRLFVLTASPNALIELSLKRLGVFDLFEETWSVEQFSWTKANKELFYEIAKKLGVATSDCIMVDDNANVLRVAKSAGMQTVGVYDEYSKAAQEEVRAAADYYVAQFDEFLEI